jgi:hypothetical protein
VRAVEHFNAHFEVGSESLASSIVSALKMLDFTDEPPKTVF